MLQDIDLQYSGGILTSGHAINAAGLLANGVDVNDVQAGDHGLIAWNYDPIITGSTTTTAANTIYLAAIYLRRARTVSKLWCIINSAGATPTAGANNLGLYNASGSLLGSINIDSKISATGPQSGTLGSTITAAAGLNWVAMQFQASTQPGLGRTNVAVLGSAITNQSPAGYRFATNGSGTTLPASITPTNNSTTGAAALWAGIS